MKLRSRGTSHVSQWRADTPNGSLQSPPPAAPANPTPQVGQQQLDLLIQQVHTLATAVQDLQQIAAQLAPPGPEPAKRPPRHSSHIEPHPDRPRRGSPLSLSRSPVGSPESRSTDSSPRSRRPQLRAQPSEAGSVLGQPLGPWPEGELGRRVEELGHQLEALKGQSSKRDHDAKFTTVPPFTQWIVDEPIPPKFKIPQLEPYDGSADPLDHLESFKVLMMLQWASDALLYKAFPATLRKSARL